MNSIPIVKKCVIQLNLEKEDMKKDMDFYLLLKNISNRYGQKLFDTAKRSAADALKFASKGAIQKTAEASGDLVGNYKYLKKASK